MYNACIHPLAAHSSALAVPHGDGPSDFFDALAVAAARLSRDDIAPCEKTILVVSNFCQRVGAWADCFVPFGRCMRRV